MNQWPGQPMPSMSSRSCISSLPSGVVMKMPALVKSLMGRDVLSTYGVAVVPRAGCPISVGK